ncbi:hypothetical protein ADICYQ_5818 [Cyclobacterium qasimii M12-11B]|uniref:Uncharacterized protein n=1 Tax=Cyclobacterium qasimii M12-11B TaxID=641524 RepID=S7V596_9BACT|nr:hypothetical protein ADICYQ_5818 [Cyclobacterium qasimii M12-11B]
MKLSSICLWKETYSLRTDSYKKNKPTPLYLSWEGFAYQWGDKKETPAQYKTVKAGATPL